MFIVSIFNATREIMCVMQLLNIICFFLDKKKLEIFIFLVNYISGSLEILLMLDN